MMKELGDAFVLSLNQEYVGEEDQLQINPGYKLATTPLISGG